MESGRIRVVGTNNIILVEGQVRQIESRGAVGVLAFSDSLPSREKVGPECRIKRREVWPLRRIAGDKLPVERIHVLEEDKCLDLVDRVIMVD
jgi:hypothetical protein